MYDTPPGILVSLAQSRNSLIGEASRAERTEADLRYRFHRFNARPERYLR